MEQIVEKTEESIYTVLEELLKLQELLFCDRIEVMIRMIYENKQAPVKEATKLKEEILNCIPDKRNYSKYENYYDEINEKYKKAYMSGQLDKAFNAAEAVLLGAGAGLYLGYKSATKPKRRKRF